MQKCFSEIKVLIKQGALQLITLDVLQKRRDDLSDTQVRIDSELEIIKDRLNVIKKEIANTLGAIIEIDHMIESL
jgi:hypothetical protein